MHESTDESFYPGPCLAGHWALKSNESLVQAPTELQCWMGPINILYTYYIPWFTYCSMTHTRISQWKWGYQLHKRTMAGITYQSILLSASRGRSRSLCDCGLGSACRWIWWAYSATQSRPHCPRGLIVPPQWGNDLQVQIMAWWTHMDTNNTQGWSIYQDLSSLCVYQHVQRGA